MTTFNMTRRRGKRDEGAVTWCFRPLMLAKGRGILVLSTYA